MTISSTSVKTALLAGDGSTVIFPFSFRAFSTADVGALLQDASGVDNSLIGQFTVTLNGDQSTSPGGTITITSTAPEVGEYVMIYSAVAGTQSTALAGQGPQRPAVTEAALDRLTVISNQLLDIASRAIRWPKSTSRGSTYVDDHIRPGQVLRMTADGTGIEGSDPGDAGLAVPADQSVTDAKMHASTDHILFGRLASGAGAGQELAISAYFATLFTAASAAAMRTLLGATSVGASLFTAASTAAAQTAMGATTVGKAIFTAATAAAARAQLGATTIGDALFTAASAAAARTTLGLGSLATASTLPAGTAVSFAHFIDSTPRSVTAVIPVADDGSSSPPTTSSGTLVVSGAKATASATNVMLVEATVAVVTPSTASRRVTAALFAGNTLLGVGIIGDGNSVAEQITVRGAFAPGNTSSVTYSVRLGTTAGTVYNNSFNGTDEIFGGNLRSSIRLTEIQG